MCVLYRGNDEVVIEIVKLERSGETDELTHSSHPKRTDRIAA